MTIEKAKEIKYMILKELSRFSFTDLCEGWLLACEEVEEFLNYGIKYLENKDSEDKFDDKFNCLANDLRQLIDKVYSIEERINKDE